jgi:effector-binding domain-containing protein
LKKIKSKFLLIGIAILLGFVGLYQYIKSEKPLEITIKEISAMRIQGVYFEGDWQDEKLKGYFKKADSIAQNTASISTSIYYNDPNDTDGFMKVFVGISNGAENPDPDFSEIREIPEGSVVYGKISNNYFQIPQRIYLQMEEFAREGGYEIGELSIEQYFSDSLMIVYIPIVKK